MAEWRMNMRAQSLADRTINERIRVTRQFVAFTDTAPLDIDAEQILQWLSTLPSANTRWSYYTSLKAFFKWLEISEKRCSNPFLRIRAPKRPKYKPRPVALEHIEFILSQNLHRRTRCMIMLAFNCGLRVSEIAKVRGQDYDPLTGGLTVEGKGGKIALVPVNKQLQPFFNTMPRRGYWFPSYSHPGQHVRSRSVGDTIVHVFARYGITITAHQLRHSFGTELLRASVDIRVVQELMRHESIQTTALYTRVVQDQKQEGTDMLPVFLGDNA